MALQKLFDHIPPPQSQILAKNLGALRSYPCLRCCAAWVDAMSNNTAVALQFLVQPRFNASTLAAWHGKERSPRSVGYIREQIMWHEQCIIRALVFKVGDVGVPPNAVARQLIWKEVFDRVSLNPDFMGIGSKKYEQIHAAQLCGSEGKSVCGTNPR